MEDNWVDLHGTAIIDSSLRSRGGFGNIVGRRSRRRRRRRRRKRKRRRRRPPRSLKKKTWNAKLQTCLHGENTYYPCRPQIYNDLSTIFVTFRNLNTQKSLLKIFTFVEMLFTVDFSVV